IKYVYWIGNDFGYTYRFQLSGFANRLDAGRGIQYDNSFHHRVDGVNNTLSYGIGYAHAFIEWAFYVRNTEFGFEENQIKKLIDYYLDGICKMSVYGNYLETGAMNRDISRPGSIRRLSTKYVAKLMEISDYRKEELIE